VNEEWNLNANIRGYTPNLFTLIRQNDYVMINHDFHKIIGDILKNDPLLKESGYELILDSACGGNRNISFFCSNKVSRDTRFAQPDIIIHDGDGIRVVLEIEHSNIRPVYLMGKFFGNAIGTNFYFEKRFITQKNALFIQICDVAKLKKGNKKEDQFSNIQNQINSKLPLKESGFEKYQLLSGTPHDFTRGKEKELVDIIHKFLKIN